MKLTFLFLILLSCVQCTVKNNFTGLKQGQIKSIVENKKLNVVYRGIRNPLTIYMPYTDSIKVTGLGLHKVKDYEYYIAPGSGLKTEILIIGYINGREIIDKREFRILGIQEAYASIHKYFGKVKLSKEKLSDSKIEIHIPQFIVETPDVASFKYQINNWEPLQNEGNSFDNLAKHHINNLKKGDSITIDNVKLVTDNPNEYRARVIELKIYIE